MRGVKRVVCLENSRKLAGRCVAGREWIDGRAGGWIRPVSDRENREVSEYERQYEDGSDPRILDIVDVPLLEPRPADHQTENWLLDPEDYWVKVGRLSWQDLPSFAEDPAVPLWIDGHSTDDGLNDKVPPGLVGSLEDSLKLIHVDVLQLSVCRPTKAFGNTKRHVQGDFSYAGNRYRLRLTDPAYERRYLAKPNGDYRIGECLLTVSLGEPRHGACRKLIATVFSRERGWRP